MYNYPLSLVFGVLTLLFMMSSYFFNSKKMYLAFQLIGAVMTLFNYLFIEEYFAMVAITVSISRTLTFYLIEKRGKTAPIWSAVMFSMMLVAVYVIVNLVILGTAKPLDILNLIATACYTFIFRLKNIRVVRYSMILPHIVSMTYLVLLGAAPFVLISFIFEFLANITAIIKDKITSKKAESTDEQ